MLARAKALTFPIKFRSCIETRACHWLYYNYFYWSRLGWVRFLKLKRKIKLSVAQSNSPVSSVLLVGFAGGEERCTTPCFAPSRFDYCNCLTLARGNRPQVLGTHTLTRFVLVTSAICGLPSRPYFYSCLWLHRGHELASHLPLLRTVTK